LAHKTQVKFKSHFSGEKIASYGPGNTVYFKTCYLTKIIHHWWWTNKRVWITDGI